MKSASRDGRQHNALKHGAFAKELIILSESQKDFDELHRAFVQELKPNGRMEEGVVLDIAKLIWRKRRVERLIVDEAEWLQVHPDNADLQKSGWVVDLIEEGMPCLEVWELLAFLPEPILDAVLRKFGRPSANMGDEWIAQLLKFIEELRIQTVRIIYEKRGDARFIGETASKIRELTAKQAVLDERFDLMFDKALRRLATLKAFKEAMAVPSAGQPRKISAA